MDLICREFNVSETWLRTGEGEMFQPKSRNEELFEFAAKVAEGDPGSIQSQLLAVMSRLTDEQWEVLAQVAGILRRKQKIPAPVGARQSGWLFENDLNHSENEVKLSFVGLSQQLVDAANDFF